MIRVSADGMLLEIYPDSNLPEMFPVKARFIRDVMGGIDHKGVLVKGSLRAVNAHHIFADEVISSTSLEISHYKWCTGAIDRLNIRYQELAEKGIPFSEEYKKILDHYHQHGRFAWEEFGGVMVERREASVVGFAEVLVAARTAPHPRDISADDLDAALAASDQPELLRELVELSRQVFGFYVGQFSYTINYPWVAARLAGLAPGSRVLDIGSGVSPLPLWLAKRGVLVDCVDSHPIVRTPPAADDWNEWGFFDYGPLDPKLSSHHRTIAEFTPIAGFDAIYAVCVLAHMPREAREAALCSCRGWLQPGGILLLAIDLIPSSDFLWNRYEGREVEPPIQHGTINDVLRQMEELGFQLNEAKILRTVPKSRTDLLFVSCKAA
jgi:SAM-dependent methyltransferase